MPAPRVTVVIPTLGACASLPECLEGLERQTFRGFEIVVVDNSGQGLVRRGGAVERVARIIENPANAGFGGAVNQAFRLSGADYLAALNDDAVPHPAWLEALVAAMDRRPDCGMGASSIRLAGEGCLDSAGMLIAGDGSSKQRGHRQHPDAFPCLEEALLPSGCAALYRRTMLEEAGLFDEDFFLYCEDTDLGLRARWSGWKCLYVPGAVVDHLYSHTAGRASPLKAYYVERNRLFLAVKNFPLPALLAAPFYSAARYFWHLLGMVRGEGAASRFREEGNAGPRLLWMVMRAHAAALAASPRLLRQRREIRRRAKVPAAEFQRLLRGHWISVRDLAAL